MAEAVKDYAVDQIQIVMGAAPMTGFSEGSKASFTKPEDSWLVKVGVGGTVTRARKQHPIIVCTLKLMKTSISNDILSGLHALDMKTKGGGRVPFLLKDLWGTTLAFAPESWVVKIPDENVDEEVTSREWSIVIVSDIHEGFWLGGN